MFYCAARAVKIVFGVEFRKAIPTVESGLISTSFCFNHGIVMALSWRCHCVEIYAMTTP